MEREKRLLLATAVQPPSKVFVRVEDETFIVTRAARTLLLPLNKPPFG